MSGFELVYFPQHGRGLAIRLMFTKGGVEFVDKHVSKGEWRSGLRDAGTWPSLPQLSHGGVVLYDTPAIQCYVASHTGHWPEDPLARARALAVLNRADEVWTLFARVVQPRGPLAKAWRLRDALTRRLPAFCEGVERSFGGDYLLGDAPMAPDYAVFAPLYVASTRAGKFGVDRVIGRYPRLHAMFLRVRQDPAVADVLCKAFE